MDEPQEDAMPSSAPEDLSRYHRGDAAALAARFDRPEAPVTADDVRGAMRLAGLTEATAAEVEAALARWRTEPA